MGAEGDSRQAELRSQLLALKSVVEDITDSQRELSIVQQSQHEGRLHQWASADPSLSVQARDRLADFNVVDHTLDVLRLKAELAMLVERRDFIRLLISVLQSDDHQAAMGL